MPNAGFLKKMQIDSSVLGQISPPTQSDLAAVKARQHSAWSSGDYAVVGTTLQIVGEDLCEALDIRPGQTVLDIGSGWGGLAMTLARDYGAKVTGVTLSIEQLELARERARAAGLADRVDFQLADYREVERKFDRIVSVGML
jgi:2-polyprenyl-3-methyl-5-hydroxy-6-metoxy-1,4-benzoquinol methylase